MGRDMDIRTSATRDGRDKDGSPSPWQFYQEFTEFVPPVPKEYSKTFDRAELIALMQSANEELTAESTEYDRAQHLRMSIRFYGLLLYHMNDDADFVSYDYR